MISIDIPTLGSILAEKLHAFKEIGFPSTALTYESGGSVSVDFQPQTWIRHVPSLPFHEQALYKDVDQKDAMDNLQRLTMKGEGRKKSEHIGTGSG